MTYSEVSIRLPGGTIVGSRKQNVIQARGIKYADANRFEIPRPFTKWDAPIDGTRPASICPQLPSRLNSVTGNLVQGRVMDEDCLHLTITAPARAIDEGLQLPVMVFLHGGANVSGGGDLDCYLPDSLIRKDIVVVNVSYRLGIFGWVPMEGIAPANLGLLDQIEALRWVQTNISHFGGCPQLVTIIGHSVGAYAIYCMMVADTDAGLFHRAILQSTPFEWQTVSATASDDLAKIARKLIQGDPRTMSAEELLLTQSKIMPEARRLGLPRTFAWAHFGKHPLPDISEVPNRIAQAATKYSIILTWTKNESVAFVPMLPSYSFWADLRMIGPAWKQIAAWWYSRKEFIWPSQRFHKSFIAAGGSSSTVSFSWSPAGNTLGAVHCIELPFICGTWDAWKDAPMLRGSKVKEVGKLGEEVINVWAAFIAGSMIRPITLDIS
ncbi:hypothetical protein FVER53590_29980 [Fusarium verticillioides]|nr:hypothetical protein FVER53590_29980 [Fusarium verticillioides]